MDATHGERVAKLRAIHEKTKAEMAKLMKVQLTLLEQVQQRLDREKISDVMKTLE